jgi:hypothetical protein
MSYLLRFTRTLSIPTESEPFRNVPSSHLWAPSRDLPALIVEKLPAAQAVLLATHITNNRGYFRRQLLSPDVCADSDTWGYYWFILSNSNFSEEPAIEAWISQYRSRRLGMIQDKYVLDVLDIDGSEIFNSTHPTRSARGATPRH